MSIDDSLPTDLASAQALIIAQRQALSAAELRAAAAESEAQYRARLIDKLKFTIRKLRHERFGQSSERGTLLDQLELQLADLEADAAQTEAAAQMAAAANNEKITVASFERRRPARRPLPEHLPRERIVYPAPSACPCCGGTTLHKIGEDVTETLELIPRQWKVIQHIREKFSCRACEAISQPPAPSHPIARGRAGPKLLAHVLFSKYGLHLPLNRQSAVYAREGIDLDVSTLADWVGAAAATLMPLVEVIRTHVFAAERIHADDTTVPVLAKGKTRTGRLWTYVRDDRPFAGPGPPAALFFYSRDRGGEHPEQHLAGYTGLMQADVPESRGKWAFSMARTHVLQSGCKPILTPIEVCYMRSRHAVLFVCSRVQREQIKLGSNKTETPVVRAASPDLCCSSPARTRPGLKRVHTRTLVERVGMSALGQKQTYWGDARPCQQRIRKRWRSSSAVRTSAEECPGQQSLQPPAARMEVRPSPE